MCDCICPISDIKLHIYRKTLSDCISSTIFPINSLTDVSDDSLNAVFYSRTSFSTFAFISRLCSEDDGIIILTYKIDDDFNFRVVNIDNNSFIEDNTNLIVHCDIVDEAHIIPEFTDIIDDLIAKTYKSPFIPAVERAWFNDPYTSVTWTDGTVTKCKAGEDDNFSKDVGVAICLAKKFLMSEGSEYPKSYIRHLVETGIDLKEKRLKKARQKAAKKGIQTAITVNTEELITSDIVLDPSVAQAITISVSE